MDERNMRTIEQRIDRSKARADTNSNSAKVIEDTDDAKERGDNRRQIKGSPIRGLSFDVPQSVEFDITPIAPKRSRSRLKANSSPSVVKNMMSSFGD